MVDNTIALQVRPFQMPDVGQIYGQAQNIQANRMRMAEAQETARERNALRGLMASGVDLNTPEGLNQLRRAAPMLAPQFEQAASQRAYQTAQTARLRAQTDADRFKLYRGQLGGVNDQAAWDDWRGRVVQEFPQFAGSIPQRFSPQARSDVAGGAELLIQRATADAAAARPDEFSRTLRAANILPGTPEYEAAMRARVASLTGGRAPREQAFIGPDGRPLIVNLDTGVFRLAQETPMGAAPGAAQPAVPNAMLAPPAAAAPAPAVTAPPAVEAPPVDLRRPAPPAVAPAAAPATFADMQAVQLARQLAQRRGEQAVTQEGAPARAAEAGETAEAQARGRATVEMEAEERRRQRGRESIESVLGDMVASYRRLDELGGIPSERRSGLANVPAYLGSTAPGQEVGKALGTQSQTQRNQIQASVRQLLTAIKNATGMSAQEMNSNVELQQLLAAVSSPTQSIESVRGILSSISRQYGLGQLNFPEPTAAPPAAAPREQTPGPRRGAATAPGAVPTLEQFLAAARRANPNVPDDALTAYYNRTYGGR
jgi:hypothetical protein